jgi:selenoprotein W-related protein
MSEKPAVTITFCTQCNWLLRSGWMAQELLSTFATELGSVTLVPATGGLFEIRVGEEVIWERRRDGGFPDIVELKRLVRDRVAPERSLGHGDRPRSGAPGADG